MADVPESPGEQEDYLSYLLRLWRAGDGEKVVWRAWLKSARTGRQMGFAHLEELFDFLQRKTGLLPSSALEERQASHPTSDAQG